MTRYSYYSAILFRSHYSFSILHFTSLSGCISFCFLDSLLCCSAQLLMVLCAGSVTVETARFAIPKKNSARPTLGNVTRTQPTLTMNSITSVITAFVLTNTGSGTAIKQKRTEGTPTFRRAVRLINATERSPLCFTFEIK